MQRRSTFPSFKQYFTQDQKKKGVHYANSEELEKAAFAAWVDTTPKNKLRIKELASGNITKADLKKQSKVNSVERSTIKQFVRSKLQNNKILGTNIYLIDVNCYCKTTAGRHLVGECCLVRFNLQDGILDSYHNHVSPGKVPSGYHSDVKRNSKLLGLKPIDEDVETDHFSLLSDIKKFVQFSGSCMLFTETEKVPAVEEFIQHLAIHVSEDPTKYLVYKVDYLLYVLYNELKGAGKEWMKEEITQELERERFTDYPGTTCEYHYENDKTGCSLSRAKSWAYTILDKCCPVVDIDTHTSTHAPKGYHPKPKEPSTSSTHTVTAGSSSSRW